VNTKTDNGFEEILINLQMMKKTFDYHHLSILFFSALLDDAIENVYAVRK